MPENFLGAFDAEPVAGIDYPRTIIICILQGSVQINHQIHSAALKNSISATSDSK